MVEDLLELADHLARREAGKPRQISLRRAVSTAYYALFHALAALCADKLIGWSKPWEAFTPIYRSLDHSVAKKLFEKGRSGRTFGPAVADIGRTFILLQQARHTADYDPEPFRYGRKVTFDLITEAREAVRAIMALPPRTKLLLAAHLIARPR